MTFEELLRAHHGGINRFLVSYSFRDTPIESEKYDEWFAETNKDFRLNMDLKHADQKLEDFAELKIYLDKTVIDWDLWTEDGERILEVELE